MKPVKTLFLFLLMTALVVGMTGKDEVKTFILKNGLKVIVLEDQSIPNVAMYMFWKVGSRNEYPGITGLSHFFEHMMFNGAKKYGPKMFDRVMEAAGGANNAYTTENVTVYSDWFPTSAIETIFDLEADRIANLALDEKMIESERGVVHSEYLTGRENSNFSLLQEQVKSCAFIAHPYKWTVIGYESDILNWKKEDLQKYFDTYYAPNNGVLVISGAVTLDQIKKLTKEYFEPIPANDPPRKIHTTEPEQMGEKRVMVAKDVTSPNMLIAFHVPETKSEDYYAIDLLSSILSDGRSSRFNSEIIDKKQLAVQAWSYYPMSFDPNLFYIFGVCNQNINENDLENAIYEEINKIVKDGVSEKELNKVKNNKLVEFYRTMQTINGKANTIGTYELFFGDYNKMFSAPEDYKKVTREDIQRVAKTYLKKSNRTVGILKKGEEN